MQRRHVFVYAGGLVKVGRPYQWVICSAASLWLVGCERVAAPVPVREARPVPAETRALFAAPLRPLAPELRGPAASEEQHFPERLSIASPSDVNPARRVDIDVYRPNAPGPQPVVLVLPSAGGSYWIEESFARYFAERGYAAVLLRREKVPRGEKVIAAIDRLLRQSVIDGARVLDWIETQPDIDGGRIGLFGISMGGIKAAVLAPLEPRFGAIVLGLAGGDLPVILTQTTEPGIAGEREAWLAATGLDLAGAERELRRVLRHDPLTYAPYADPRRYLLILARFDRAVPTAKGWQLWSALGEPETILLPTGHHTAVLAMPWLKPAIVKFFDARLALPVERPIRKTSS